jgi:hypothetical protein
MRCDSSQPFRDELLRAAQHQLSQQQRQGDSERDVRHAKAIDLESQERNLRKSIRLAGDASDEDLKGLVEDLAFVTKQLKEIRAKATAAESSDGLFRNYSDHEIRENLPKVLMHLLTTSFEMAELMRRFVPQSVIVPVQSLDTGQVYPRSKLLVRGHMEDYERLDELVMDLFEPPLHIRIMPKAVEMRRQEPRPTLKQIGTVLNVSYMSVKRALAYDRLMKEAGVSEPFIELRDKPTNASRWRYETDKPADDAA